MRTTRLIEYASCASIARAGWGPRAPPPQLNLSMAEVTHRTLHPMDSASDDIITAIIRRTHVRSYFVLMQLSKRYHRLVYQHIISIVQTTRRSSIAMPLDQQIVASLAADKRCGMLVCDAFYVYIMRSAIYGHSCKRCGMVINATPTIYCTIRRKHIYMTYVRERHQVLIHSLGESITDHLGGVIRILEAMLNHSAIMQSPPVFVTCPGPKVDA